MLSPAQSLASLPEDQRQKAIDALKPEVRAYLRWHWPFWARPNQLPPDGDWLTWLILAGRGYGKTRSGAEWVRSIVCGKTPMECGSHHRIAIVAETAADARDVLVEGDSGILAVHPKDFRPLYEPSKRRLTWPNGAVASLYNGTEPDQLRGPQHDAALIDELAKYAYAQDTWDMLQFGLRLGDHPKQMVTTTPRPIKLIKDIIASPMTVVTRGSTLENAANLAPAFMTQIVARYEGTRLGRQELNAEILDDAPGALWQRDLIDLNRVAAPKTEAERQDLIGRMKRIVVAMDPAATSTEGADEMGIVVASLGQDDHGYVLADMTDRLSPDQASRRAILAYDEWRADRIVGEVNNGGEWIGHTIRMTARAMQSEGLRSSGEVAYKAVHASKGKQTRAEPIAALDEQRRVHHVGAFPDLEDQMCEWEPLSGEKSPDRIDARVWALTELMLEQLPGAGLHDFYRQQVADSAAKPKETPTVDVVALRAPAGISVAYGMSGTRYAPQSDGRFLVAKDDAGPLRAAGFRDA